MIFIESARAGKQHKRVIIHVPLKVKHVHHTHTVYKPVHHAIPVKVDHPEHWDDDIGEYHYGNGRMLDSLLGDWKPGANLYSQESEDERESEYDHFEQLLKKISKNKQKLFNNKLIGWNGRQNFDKIASEYLLNLKKRKQPEFDEYDERYSPYDDEDDDSK